MNSRLSWGWSRSSIWIMIRSDGEGRRWWWMTAKMMMMMIYYHVLGELLPQRWKIDPTHNESMYQVGRQTLSTLWCQQFKQQSEEEEVRHHHQWSWWWQKNWMMMRIESVKERAEEKKGYNVIIMTMTAWSVVHKKTIEKQTTETDDDVRFNREEEAKRASFSWYNRMCDDRE